MLLQNLISKDSATVIEKVPAFYPPFPGLLPWIRHCIYMMPEFCVIAYNIYTLFDGFVDTRRYFASCVVFLLRAMSKMSASITF